MVILWVFQLVVNVILVGLFLVVRLRLKANQARRASDPAMEAALAETRTLVEEQMRQIENLEVRLKQWMERQVGEESAIQRSAEARELSELCREAREQIPTLSELERSRSRVLPPTQQLDLKSLLREQLV